MSESSFAQPTPPDQEKAETLFLEGEKLYKLGEYEKALANYRESYLLSSAPELLFNIGQCYRKMGRKEEALIAYKSYLRDVPDSPSYEQVAQLISELEAPASIAATKPTLPEEPSARSELRFIPPLGLGVVGLALGGGALLTRSEITESGINNEELQRRGVLLSVGSDSLLFASVASLAMAVYPKELGILRSSVIPGLVAMSVMFGEGAVSALDDQSNGKALAFSIGSGLSLVSVGALLLQKRSQ